LIDPDVPSTFVPSQSAAATWMMIARHRSLDDHVKSAEPPLLSSPVPSQIRQHVTDVCAGLLELWRVVVAHEGTVTVSLASIDSEMMHRSPSASVGRTTGAVWSSALLAHASVVIVTVGNAITNEGTEAPFSYCLVMV
jgi:hypothetical protein